jgi:plastocyanin
MVKYTLLIIAFSSLALTFATRIEAAEKKYKEITVTKGGYITGTVSFDGDIPTVELARINKDHKFCGKEPRPSPALKVHPDKKGIKNVVVSIEDISEGKPFDASGVHPLLDQQGCMFIPHVLVITAGTTVDILNGDSLMHNVHSHCIKNPPFNEGTTFKQRLSKRFDFEEEVRISCDVHKWMSSWILVKGNPYFALTDGKGRFLIEDIPPGAYKLQAWHESLGINTKEINISPNEELKVNFSFNSPSE